MKKGLCIAFAILMTIIVAFATVGKRTVTLAYDNVKIVLDGKEVIPRGADGSVIEPFIIEGTTYLPVRGVSSALGLNVGWNGQTKTVTLTTPGVFQGGVQVYDDKYVTIEFAGCTSEKPYSFSNDVRYYANFNVRNKTNVELTFQSDALSFNGVSHKVMLGSDNVAPQSTGKIRFMFDEVIPTTGINNTSGTIRVIDFEYEVLENSYDARWINVTK